MKVTVQRNDGSDPTMAVEQYPYFAHVRIFAEASTPGKTYKIPIGVRYQGIRKTFLLEVCGFSMTAAHPSAFTQQLPPLLLRLTNASRLPSYVFIARRAQKIYPVYAVDDEVFAISHTGHIFRHVELAKVREYLTDYLHHTDVLGAGGLSDKLHVRGISRNSLMLRRPVLYLKKRIDGQTDFWAPVFETGSGDRIYAYVANARREAKLSNGLEVLELWERIGWVLIRDKRLADVYDLRPDRLLPEYWERLKVQLEPAGELSVNGFVLPLFHSPDGDLLSVEFRETENRYGLFVGRDHADVQRRVAADFARREHFA